MRLLLKKVSGFATFAGKIIGGIAVWLGIAVGLIWLAGGVGAGLHEGLYWLWPAPAAVIIFLMFFDSGIIEKGIPFLPRWPAKDAQLLIGPFTGTAIFLFFLPIILNATSSVLEWMGQEAAAKLLFSLRWDASILLVGGIGVLLTGIVTLLTLGTAFWRAGRWLKRKAPDAIFVLSV